MLSENFYSIRKIGNNDQPESHNNPEWFDFEGDLAYPLEIGKVCLLGTISRYFHTSIVRSIYEHLSESELDRLILPKDFPMSQDLNVPELRRGDILLATMNSVYLLRKTDKS